MSKTKHIILSLLAAVSLNSCVLSGKNRYMPVLHSKPRVSTLGFSVTPPPGNNWYEKVNEESISYFKKIKPKHYLIYTKASEIYFDKEFSNPEAFLQFVKQKKEINTAPQRYSNPTAQYASRSVSATCVEYHHQYEEHGLKKPQEKERRAQVSTNGIICIHPRKPHIGIDLFYLEKTLVGKTNAISYAREGEEFLNSLSFL